MTDTTDVQTYARQILVRAGHTAWQAGAAVAGTLWATSGLHIADLATARGWSILWTSVVMGVLAAALSGAKTTILGALASAVDKSITPPAIEAPAAPTSAPIEADTPAPADPANATP